MNATEAKSMAPAPDESGGDEGRKPAGWLRRFLARHRLSLGIVVAALGTMFFLLLGGALHDSPTIDEPNHILRGMALLETKDGRLSFSHPPLANALQAVPASMAGTSFDIGGQKGFKEWSLDQVIRRSISGDYPALRSAIVSGRFMTAALALLTGLYLFFLTRSFFGARAACFALILYALNPVFLAHGRQVTTDLPMALGALLVGGELARYLGSRSPWRLLSLGLALGFACAVKFSALLLVLPLLAGMVLGAIRGSARFEGFGAGRRLLSLGRDFVLVGLLTLLVVNASYGFQRTGMSVGAILDHEPSPVNWIVKRERGDFLEEVSFLPSLPAWLPVPLPYPYVYGLFTIKAQSDRGHGGWFLGERRGEPHLLYFPIMMFIKSPASLILFALLGLFFCFGRGWRGRLVGLAEPLALLPLIYFLALLGSGIQIGVRHAMPVLIFLFLFAGWAAAKLWERERWGRGLAVGLLLLLGVEVAASHPRHLGHFSWLIGGPMAGHRISQVGEDWGQDVADLARLVKEEGMEPLYYWSFGAASRPELRFHGVEPKGLRCGRPVPEPGWLATHAAQMLRTRKPCIPGEPGRAPDRIVNHHLWLYRVE